MHFAAPADSSSPNRYFQIDLPLRTYYFYAETLEDMRYWLRILTESKSALKRRERSAWLIVIKHRTHDLRRCSSRGCSVSFAADLSISLSYSSVRYCLLRSTPWNVGADDPFIILTASIIV